MNYIKRSLKMWKNKRQIKLQNHRRAVAQRKSEREENERIRSNCKS